MRSLGLAGLALLLAAGCGRTDRLERASRAPELTLFEVALPTGTIGVAYAARLPWVAEPRPAEIAFRVTEGALPPGLRVAYDGLAPDLRGVPSAVGRFSFSLEARASDGRRATAAYAVEVVGGDSLEIVTQGLPAAFTDVDYAAPLAARGGEPPYAWRVAAGRLPDGLGLVGRPAGAAIEGRPAVPGTAPITLEVTDARGEAAQRDFELAVFEPSDRIQIVTEALPTIGVFEEVALRIEAEGGAGGYRWTVEGFVPPGLVLEPSGTPATVLVGAAEQPGRFEIQVRVTDRVGATAARVFGLEVTGSERLRIVTDTLPRARVGEDYAEPIIAEGGAPPYTWGVVQGTLPFGLTLDGTGSPFTRLRGVPTTPGIFDFTVEVADQGAAAASRSLRVEVEAAASRLQWVTAELPSGRVGRAYQADLEARGGTPPYVWRLTSGTIPPGLSLAVAGPTRAVFSGTPTAPGAFDIDLSVEDAGGQSAPRRFRIAVAAPPPTLSVATARLPNGQLCAGYEARVEPSGGLAPYVWSVASGSLPPGLALGAGSDPSISGYPDQPGSYPFTLQVQDAAGQVANQDYVVDVPLRPGAPRWAMLLGPLALGRDVFLADICGPTPVPAVRAANGAGRLSGTEAALSPINEAAAFVGDYRRSGVDELFLVDLRGPTPGAPVLLHPPGTFSQEVDRLSFSPNGKYIAFVGDLTQDRRTEVWVVDVLDPANPGPPRRVSSLPRVDFARVFDLEWSPNGRWLAYRATFEVTGRSDLYVTSPTSTTGHTRVSAFTDPQRDVNGFAWSPAGDGLAYAADQDVDGQVDLYWVPWSGGRAGAPVRVSALRPNGDVFASRLGFSADGRILSYVATQDSTAAELYAVDLRGRPPLASVKVNPTLPANRRVARALWSPAANRLVYVADQDADNQDELFLVDLSNPAAPASPVRLNPALSSGSDVRASEVGLAWTPTGDAVGFLVSGFSQPDQVYVADLSGGAPVLRAAGPARSDPRLDARGLLFSPDGGRLALWGELATPGVVELFAVDLGSPASIPFRVNGALVSNGDVSLGGDAVAWRADNTGLLYIADQATDFVNEAWIVSLLGGGVGPAERLHAPLPTGRRVERISVQQ